MNDKLAREGLSAGDLTARTADAQAMEVPARVAHIAGPSMDPLTWFASQGNSPEAAALTTAIRDAQRGEVGVLNRGITEMSGVPDAPAMRTAVVQERLAGAKRAGADVNYPRAYEQPPIIDEGVLRTIREDPDLTNVLRRGVDLMRREGINMLDPLAEGSGGAIPIQLFDYVKRGANLVTEQGLARGDLDAVAAGVLNRKVNDLLAVADGRVPEYAAARSRFGEIARQEEAATQGTKAFGRDPATLALELNELSEPQRAAYRTTATDALRETTRDKRYGNDITGGVFDTPTIDEQMGVLYGPDGRQRFGPYREQARSLNRVNQSVSGNSKTAERESIKRELQDELPNQALRLLSGGKRSGWDVLGRVGDYYSRNTAEAMQRILAERLGLAVDDPRLPRLLEELQSTQEGSGQARRLINPRTTKAKEVTRRLIHPGRASGTIVGQSRDRDE